MAPDFGYAAGCNKSSTEVKITKVNVKRKRAMGRVMLCNVFYAQYHSVE